MVVAVSPFRYLSLARYVLSKWLDTAQMANWKGKERALSHLNNRLDMAIAGGSATAYTASVEERRRDSNGYDGPVAGPSTFLPPPLEPLRPDPRWPPESNEIYRLMNDERLTTPGGIKPPREVVVLCHGLYGFSTATPIPLFPSLKLHYWASVLEILRDKMGVNVLVVGVKGTGSIKERAEQMHDFLKDKLPKGTGVNFVAHSMGGLDCRHLISTIKPTTYTPLSLTTIGTPHRGSPFMDWCAANIGVGSVTAAAAAAAALGSTHKVMKALPYSLKAPLLSHVTEEASKKEEGGFSAFTGALNKYLLSIFDSPAYSNLTTSFLRDQFNPHTPDDPNVKYTSVAGRIYKMSVLHPLWFTKLVLDASAENGYAEDEGASGKQYEGNDGLVSVSSAKWGEFIGAVDECHHWDLRGEGGIFPTGGSYGNKPEVKDKQNNDEWKWREKLDNGVGEHLGLENKAKLEKTIEDARKVAETAVNKATPSSSWDVAQVGQVIDWVADLLPGNTTETQKKQLADAQREKEKDEARKAGVEEKKKKSKFDLARFYGGLMIKLRDDGF